MVGVDILAVLSFCLSVCLITARLSYYTYTIVSVSAVILLVQFRGHVASFGHAPLSLSGSVTPTDYEVHCIAVARRRCLHSSIPMSLPFLFHSAYGRTQRCRLMRL